MEIQQIADGVVVLRAVQTMERLGPSRIGVGDSGPIELGFQPGDEPIVRSCVRPGARGRRHGASTQLAHHGLPDGGRLTDPGEVEPLERQSGCLQPIVMAGEAVALDQRTLPFRVRRLGHRNRLRASPRDDEEADGGQQADGSANGSGKRFASHRSARYRPAGRHGLFYPQPLTARGEIPATFDRRYAGFHHGLLRRRDAEALSDR